MLAQTVNKKVDRLKNHVKKAINLAQQKSQVYSRS